MVGRLSVTHSVEHQKTVEAKSQRTDSGQLGFCCQGKRLVSDSMLAGFPDNMLFKHGIHCVYTTWHNERQYIYF